MASFEVTIFYKYTNIADPETCRDWIRELCKSVDIKGRILVASEGINGTVEGMRDQLDQFETALKTASFGDFQDLWFKASPSTGAAFKKLKVKARENILNAGLEEDIDPNRVTGEHIPAQELHEWFERGDEFTIVDMRNTYEYAVGRFKGAIDPGMTNFRDLKKATQDLEPLKEKKILTVCTYGVRCEKASGFLRKQGFKNVYQLHGGIGTYLKKYPGQNFEGSLYVFDERITEQFTDNYEVVGECVDCHNKTERLGNCAWHICHKQLVICKECAPSPVWCSKECSEKQPSTPSKSDYGRSTC
jgi:UPF0176 protein